jgi:hypothetical protein
LIAGSRATWPRMMSRTVVGLGLSGMRNGALLRRAEGRCDVFVTVDRNLAFQQPITGLPFAVVVLRARPI